MEGWSCDGAESSRESQGGKDSNIYEHSLLLLEPLYVSKHCPKYKDERAPMTSMPCAVACQGVRTEVSPKQKFVTPPQ